METTNIDEQLNSLDINKEEAVDNTEPTKLSKGQKKRLKEKEKKLKQKQEQESGVTSSSPSTTNTVVSPTPVIKVEPSKPETPAEKFNRQIQWAIYQLILGQQRKDTTKDQWKESETIINKLKSDKVHDARKIQLMHSVFGKNLDKVMKQYPLPKDVINSIKSDTNTSTEPAATTNNSNNNNNNNINATTSSETSNATSN